MDRLEEAIERQDWERAAYYIALGAVRLLHRLQDGDAEAFLELLETRETGRAHPRRRRQRESSPRAQHRRRRGMA